MGTDTDGIPEGGGKTKGNDKYVNNQRKPFVNKKPFVPGNQSVKHVKFEGASSDLKGHVFDVMSSKIKQIDEYNSTLEQIMTYVGTNMDPLVLEAIENLSVTTLTEPVPITQEDGTTVSNIEMKKWEKRFNRFLSREEQVEKEIKKLYALVWGQSSDAMQTRIQESQSYKKVHKDKNGIGVLIIIKAISFSYRAHQEPVVALDAVKHEFFKLVQGKYQLVQDYYDTIMNMVNVNKELGAEVGKDIRLVEIVAA